VKAAPPAQANQPVVIDSSMVLLEGGEEGEEDEEEGEEGEDGEQTED